MNHLKIQFLKIIIYSHKSVGLLGCLYLRRQMCRPAPLVSHLPCVLLMEMAGVQKRSPKCTGIFKAPPYVACGNFPLAKTSHMIKSKVKEKEL